MDVNENAGSRGVASTIVGAPPGACSLLQEDGRSFPDKFKNAGDKKWPKQKYSVAPGSVAR